jgi:hypothetical protein
MKQQQQQQQQQQEKEWVSVRLCSTGILPEVVLVASRLPKQAPVAQPSPQKSALCFSIVFLNRASH